MSHVFTLKRVSRCVAIIAAAGMTVALSGGAQAQRFDRDGRRADQDWQRLGCVSVGRRAEREVIEVGRRDGRFMAIRLDARNNDVLIDDLRIIYGNGKPDDLRVRAELREGQTTRAIDLDGRDRFIDRIEIRLRKDFEGRKRGPATLCVSGLESRGGGRRAEPLPARGFDWETLGCVGTGLRKDFDVVAVGRRNGRYRAIRLLVRGGDVEIDRLRVVYGNGRPDEIPVRSKIRRGEQSGPLDLQGRDRYIDRVELYTHRDAKDMAKNVIKDLLKGRPNLKGAEICVQGLDARDGGGRRRDGGPGGRRY